MHVDPAVECGEVITNQMAAMAGKPVPDQQDRLSDLFDEVLEEVPDLLLPHASLIQTEVKLPEGDSGGHREIVPVELMLQDRCLAASGPRTHAMGPLAQSAFIDEDDGAVFFPGFFLRVGQVFCFQSAIAASFRSRARPTGR